MLMYMNCHIRSCLADLRGHPRTPASGVRGSPTQPPFSASPVGLLKFAPASRGVSGTSPRSLVAGWRLPFPPPHSPQFFISLAAVIAHKSSLAVAGSPALPAIPAPASPPPIGGALGVAGVAGKARSRRSRFWAGRAFIGLIVLFVRTWLPLLTVGGHSPPVALVGLLRPVCCWARHSPPRTSGRAVAGYARFFVGWRTDLRGAPSMVSPCSQPRKVCPSRGHPDRPTDALLLAGAHAARTPLY